MTEAGPQRLRLLVFTGICALATLGLVVAVGTGTLPLWVPGQCTYNTGSIGSPALWLLPLIVWGLLVALGWFIIVRLRGPAETWSNTTHWVIPTLIALSCLFFWIHVAVIEPAGFFKLSAVVANEASCGYFTQAMDTPRTPDLFEEYQQRPFEMRHHTVNKPPGMVIFSAAIIQVTKENPLLQSLADVALRIKPGINTTAAARMFSNFWNVNYRPFHAAAALLWAIVTIVFGAATIIPLYRFALDAGGPTVALISSALFALVPAFAMNVATVDMTYLLPITWAMLLWWHSFEGNLSYAAGAGMLLGIGLLGTWMFISVTGWFALWALGHQTLVQYEKDTDPDLRHALRRAIPPILVMGAALLIPAALFFTWAQLNPWLLLQNSRIAQAAEMAAAGREYHLWIFYNIADFFAFLGIPVTLTVGYGLARDSIWKKRLGRQIAICTIAASVAILALNFSGQFLGETARIWMLFMPPFLAAAAAFGKLLRFSPAMWALLLASMLLQFVSFRHLLLLGGWI